MHPSIGDQQKFWDHKWELTQAPNEWSKRRGEAVLAWLRALPLYNPQILDIGCGTGWLTERLSHIGAATGVDLSERGIAIARARYPHLTFIRGDITEMDMAQACFDVVVSQEVIAHVQNQAGHVDFIARLLKPGGYLVLTTPNKFIVDRDPPWLPQPPEHIEQWLSMQDVKRLLRPKFDILRAGTIIPMGHRGILRIVNSPKLNAILRPIVTRKRLDALNVWAGFGYTILILGRKQ